MKIKAGQTSAFTLVEVLVVFMLSGVAITAAVGLMASSMWGSNYMEHRLNASAIAQSRLENLRTVPFAELADMAEDAERVNAQGMTDANGLYARTTTVGADYKSTRLITVSVSSGWKYDVADLQVQMSTIVMDPDILDE